MDRWNVNRLDEDMKQIHVGGYLVSVPNEYPKAEAEYTSEELAEFDKSHELGDKAVIKYYREKRLEFYNHWKAGKVIIPEDTKPTNVQRFKKWLRLS